MCKICSDWQLGNLTKKEAMRNLGELIASGFDSEEDEAHYFEILENLSEEEDEF